MKFNKLKQENYKQLKAFFKNQANPLCAYSLSSVICWENKKFAPFYTILDDTLVITTLFVDKKEMNHLILPVCQGKIFSPKELFDIAKSCNRNQYWFVPQKYIKTFEKEEIENYFEIHRQKEYDDYIYHAEDLSELKGNKYSKKRNLVNQFKKKFVQNSRTEIETITSENATKCIEFLEEWCRIKDCSSDKDDEFACEKQAAINAINHIENLGLRGILIKIDKKISAFGIASKLTDDTGVLHFEKAMSDKKGLYQYFDKQCAKRLFKGAKYINKESDMNIDGLAKAKKSYYPVEKIYSYRLVLKS